MLYEVITPTVIPAETSVPSEANLSNNTLSTPEDQGTVTVSKPGPSEQQPALIILGDMNGKYTNRITSYNVCYTKLLRRSFQIRLRLEVSDPGILFCILPPVH